MFVIKQNSLLLIFFALMFSFSLRAQDNNLLLKEAANLELKFDESGALEKYKQVIDSDSSNIKALVKCAELNCSIGGREKDKNSKANYYNQADVYAHKAYAADSQNSDACYIVGLVAYKMNEFEPNNQTLVNNIRQIKIFADKSIAANDSNAKANHLLGIWHYELINSAWLKKLSIRKFYGGIPDTQLDSAAYYMEKAKSIQPYFAIDYFDLATVYQYDHQPAKAIEVLNKLIKLPNRTYDDIAIKEQGKQMLAKMQ